jgi:hypothetical protein
MIVPLELKDDFGRKANATSTFLRHELEIARDPFEEANGSLGLYLARETLNHINKGDAPNRLHFPHSAALFRNRAKRAGGIKFCPS